MPPRQKMTDDWRGVEHTASFLRQTLVDPPTSSPKSKRCKKNLNNGQRKRHKVERASQKKPRILLLVQDLFKIKIPHSLVSEWWCLWHEGRS